MAARTHHPADSASEWTVEPFVPADGVTFTAADLGPLQPLWNSLMDRHREAWSACPCARMKTRGRGAGLSI